MKLTGAEIIVRFLEEQGITIIAGIPGGSILPLYNALHGSKIHHVLARHEQGAGFIAQGMARSTGKPAVCMATSGPGATNLVTALADAHLDAIPVIAITGQVPSGLIGTDAFQEADMISITKSIVKKGFQPRRAEELLSMLPEAFALSMSGKPGPVIIDVPKDVFMQSIDCEALTFTEQRKLSSEQADYRQQMNAVLELLAASEKPVLYAGGGVAFTGAAGSIMELSAKGDIPLAVTLMGQGRYPAFDKRFLGMAGMHGSAATNMILAECDLLIAFGNRFGDRATGKLAGFCSNAKIVHVNIGAKEIGKILSPTIGITAEIGTALRDMIEGAEKKERKGWWRRIGEIRELFPDYRPSNNGFIYPCNVIKEIAHIADQDAIITTDVGQHQMWVAQYYPFSGKGMLLTSGGLGTMGFGLPAAIGAAFAHEDRQVVCFTGDGSLLMNIQELATLAEHGLDVKVVVLNNGQLGLVRQQQDLFYGSNHIASRFAHNPDLAAIAEGFGIETETVPEGEMTTGRMQVLFAKRGPALINISLNDELQVLPMVPPGALNTEMIVHELQE